MNLSRIPYRSTLYVCLFYFSICYISTPLEKIRGIKYNLNNIHVFLFIIIAYYFCIIN